MNEALQRWREDFAREPDPAFDRLVRGIVPLGGASPLSFGEILDALFEPGDAALDTAAAAWLKKRLLGPLPENTSLHRWASILEEYFRGIAAMELPQTGEMLRRQHKRLRLWLHGFYEGPDRDPEGAYLLALARSQDRQDFSPLWRRLILGEELSGRPYVGVGILGFRKMPAQNGHESSGVPEGLLQALVELADKPGTGQPKWKQTIRSLFATYRRSEGFWVEHFAPMLPYYQQASNARDWLTALLPGIRNWRPQHEEQNRVATRRAHPVPVPVSRDWAQRVRQDPSLCDTSEFADFLNQHRAYAETTGHPNFINKTFNNLSTAIVRADSRRAHFAVTLMEEALDWAPWNPRNWTSYAIVLCDAHRTDDAIAALWKARQRFPWNPVVRNELTRLLREQGDLPTALAVCREAAAHFPNMPYCLSLLGETLREMDELEEARIVFEQACRDFPNDAVFRFGLVETLYDLGEPALARSVFERSLNDFPNNAVIRCALGSLLLRLDDLAEAEKQFTEACSLDSASQSGRYGLAEVMVIRSARTRDEASRDEARVLLQRLADDGYKPARERLAAFNERWRTAVAHGGAIIAKPSRQRPSSPQLTTFVRPADAMSVAERLGRAMIALWQAERAEDRVLRDSLCTHATALLDVPEERIDDELLAAFVETRGLVLLASGDARRALTYFEEQIRHFGRGGWIGIRLGEQRARILLGEPADEADTAEPPSSPSARFALHVARVIQSLSRAPQEAEVRELLKQLYPRAAEFAARAQTDAEGKQHIESGAEMLGAFMHARWFRPAGIQSVEDLDQPDRLHAVVERINASRTDTFDVLSNSTLDMAA